MAENQNVVSEPWAYEFFHFPTRTHWSVALSHTLREFVRRLKLRADPDGGVIGVREIDGALVGAIGEAVGVDAIAHSVTTAPIHEGAFKARFLVQSNPIVRLYVTDDIHPQNYDTRATHRAIVEAWIPPVQPVPIVQGEVKP